MTAHIAILGGGPAGSTVALGLIGLGYSVTLIHRPRPFAAIEGISERALQGLAHAGFEKALTVPEAPSPRQVAWNSAISSANVERLVERRTFDRALLQDAATQGVRVVDAQVKELQPIATGYRVTWATQRGTASLDADFLVEARGRTAPGAGVVTARGPNSVTLLQRFQGASGPAASAALSIPDGWAWLARRPGGECHVQITLDPTATRLPPRHAMADWMSTRLTNLAQQAPALTEPFLGLTKPCDTPRARGSTSLLLGDCVGSRYLRVGDAAMAVDPLSGNGIFQSLSSALQAPAVINTLLRYPSRELLAREFHQSRLDGLFYRFARIGRDFYAQELQWAEHPFWKARSHWPDAEPLHRDVTPDQVHIARRPVVAEGEIHEAEVVVTPDQPLGLWHLNGVYLAPLLRRLRATPDLPTERVIADALDDHVPDDTPRKLALWMRSQGWLAYR